MEKYSFEKSVFECLESSPIPLAVYQFINRRVVTLALSEGFMRLFGFNSRAEAYFMMDNDMYCDTHPDDVSPIADAAYRFATEGGEYDVVYRTLKHCEPDAEYRLVHAHGVHKFADTGERLAYVWYTDEGVFCSGESGHAGELNSALSKLITDDRQLRHHRYDTLTGLPKMTYFFELAEAGQRVNSMNGKPTTLLFFDLCGLGDFNRKYGFAEGDKLLLAFSKLLVHFFSSENCGRLGQDFFVVYTDKYNIEQTVRAIFEEAKSLNGGHTLPVRVGIYTARGDGSEVSEACDRAKMAVDKIRGNYFSSYAYFDESMLSAKLNRQYILENFDTALEEKWIKVYYQPIIRASNNRVCHEEALARWDDPIKGMLSPSEFIPVLEDAMLIYKLDLYVLRETLAKMKRIMEEGLFLVPSSINLSRADFDSCDIVEEVRALVDEAGIRHDLICVELTESVIGSDFSYMKEQVERFRRLGFSVWMDDFGSGYSSLDVLQNIHFDVIKFDMRFMQQFDNTDRSKIILTELTKMTIALGIRTVAEGVEEAEQVAFLRDVGCNMLQGFYYCRPISLEEILRRYREGYQIGFENPDERDFYTAIGSVSLYDPMSLVSDDPETVRRFSDTLPAAIAEVNGDLVTIIRCSPSYRAFMRRAFKIDLQGVPTRVETVRNKPGSAFFDAALDCVKNGGMRIVDEELEGYGPIHSILRLIATNPVTGVSAVAAVVLDKR